VTDWVIRQTIAAVAVASSAGLSEESSESSRWPTGFTYMVAAYIAVWVILMAYFWILTRRSERLEKRLETLLEQEKSPSTLRPPGR
jgi:CcmD family protein